MLYGRDGESLQGAKSEKLYQIDHELHPDLTRIQDSGGDFDRGKSQFEVDRSVQPWPILMHGPHLSCSLSLLTISER